MPCIERRRMNGVCIGMKRCPWIVAQKRVSRMRGADFPSNFKEIPTGVIFLAALLPIACLDFGQICLTRADTQGLALAVAEFPMTIIGKLSVRLFLVEEGRPIGSGEIVPLTPTRSHSHGRGYFRSVNGLKTSETELHIMNRCSMAFRSKGSPVTGRAAG